MQVDIGSEMGFISKYNLFYCSTCKRTIFPTRIYVDLVKKAHQGELVIDIYL